MRGTLALASTPGKGSCFILSVPCALPVYENIPGRPIEGRAKRVSQETSTIPAKTPKGLRIILAEDNKANTYFFQEVLRQAGHSVAVVDDGFDTLALLRNNPADLAILDIRMPGMNGLELTESIRKGVAGVDPALPIISITVSQSEELQARLRQLGARAQAEKPLSAAQLLQFVEQACESNRSMLTEVHSVFNRAAALEKVLEKVGGKHELLRKLVAVLLEEQPAQEQALARAMEENKLKQVHLLAHALKKSAAMLHLQQFQEASAALENAACAQQDCRQAWQVLQQAMPAAQKALRAYVNSCTNTI